MTNSLAISLYKNKIFSKRNKIQKKKILAKNTCLMTSIEKQSSETWTETSIAPGRMCLFPQVSGFRRPTQDIPWPRSHIAHVAVICPRGHRRDANTEMKGIADSLWRLWLLKTGDSWILVDQSSIRFQVSKKTKPAILGPPYSAVMVLVDFNVPPK